MCMTSRHVKIVLCLVMICCNAAELPTALDRTGRRPRSLVLSHRTRTPRTPGCLAHVAAAVLPIGLLTFWVPALATIFVGVPTAVCAVCATILVACAAIGGQDWLFDGRSVDKRRARQDRASA